MTDKEKYDAVQYSLEELQDSYNNVKESLAQLEQSLLTFQCMFKSYFPDFNDCPF